MDRFGNLGNLLSPINIKNMINKLLTSEYNYGLYLERPDIIVDASVYRREKDGMEVCSIWNSSHDKPYDIPFRSVNEHLRSLAESDGATKAALCLPNTIWGNIFITKPVSIRRGGGNQKAAQTADETDLLKSLGNELGADLIGSESSKMPDDYASYHFDNEKDDLFDTYLLSVMPGANKKLFMESDVIIPFNDLDVIRVSDRIIPLTNYVGGLLAENEVFDTCLCIEQRADNLLVWVLGQKNGKLIPLKQSSYTVPEAKAAEGISNKLNVILHELVRVKHHKLPSKVIVISNGEQMREGMFTLNELISGCAKAAYFESKNEVVCVTEKYPVIKGMLQMEERIASHREEIYRRYTSA